MEGKYKDPRDNFKEKKISFSAWLWTCIKVCVLIILLPIIFGALVLIASICLPILFIAVPVMLIAWLWLLFS